MTAFFSAGGHRWTITLTLGELRRLRATGPDLMALNEGNPPLALRLRTDPYLVGEILWTLLQPQLEERGVSEADFVAMLDGTALAAANGAFTEALLDFFQTLGRTDLAELLHTTARIFAQTLQTATLQIQQTDTPGPQSPSSPPAPAWTPGPGPSANSSPPPTAATATPGNTQPPSPPRSPPPSREAQPTTRANTIPGPTNGPTPNNSNGSQCPTSNR